jgi:hypothetical protein
MPVVLALVLALSQAGAEDLPPPPPPPDLDVLTSGVPAPVTPAAPAPPVASPVVTAGRAAPELPRLGLAADVGVPEGLTVAAMFRAVPSLRLWLGPSWNYVGLGLQGGVHWAPLPWALAPALSVEAGRYFSSDLTWLAQDSGGVPAEVEPLLRDVSYSYASVHLGFELGSPRGLAFSIRAGLSYLWLVARGTATSSDATGETRVQFTDPQLRATIPSVKLGLHYWF